MSLLFPYLREHTTNVTEKIIVVDAADSEDNIEELCLEHDIVYIKSKHSQRSKQLNQGAQLVTQGAILFLHADVTPPMTFEADIISHIEKGFDFGLFSYKFDKSRWYLKMNAYFTKFDGIFCGGGDQGHFIEQSTFAKLGGYDEGYPIMEDFEFFDRIKKAKVNYTLIDSPATVSARKYDKYSYLRINLVNLYALFMFKAKRSPAAIKAMCSRYLP